MALGIDTVLHAFDERIDPASHLDPLDGHGVEFDWDALEIALGEAYDDLDERGRDQLSQAIYGLFSFILGDSKKAGVRAEPWSSVAGNKLIALGFVLGHPALKGASLRALAAKAGVSAAALSKHTQQGSAFLSFRNRAQTAHGHGRSPGRLPNVPNAA